MSSYRRFLNSRRTRSSCVSLALACFALIRRTGSLEPKVGEIVAEAGHGLPVPLSGMKDRIRKLEPYQVNRRTLELTGNPDVKFLHCLPAFHDRNTKVGEEIFRQYALDGMEVTDEVFESDASIVFDQAENRMHSIKAIMVATLGD